jgi:hypothetical protein
MGNAKARGTYAERKAAPLGKQSNHQKTIPRQQAFTLQKLGRLMSDIAHRAWLKRQS